MSIIDNVESNSWARPYAVKHLSVLQTAQSMMIMPLLSSASEAIGTISMVSTKPHFFERRYLGRAQLLAAFLAYVIAYHRSETRRPSPDSIALGDALRRARQELGLTQSAVAEMSGISRIALSQWERGGQLPTLNQLCRCAEALGLFSEKTPALVTVVDITPHLLNLLRENPERLTELSPEKFEVFVANRLDKMGYDVSLTTPTTRKDGGIDLIAVPKARAVGTFLLAGQVKHHKGNHKTGRGDVDRLLAWRGSAFQLGLLVTNTGFTKDALWLASQEQNKSFLRLRGFGDLKRWLENNFWSQEEWREIPEELQLAPGVTVQIPKAQIHDSLSIWPVPSFSARNVHLE